jgi:transcriptional regulator with XRE-family HTH domain
MTAPSLKDRLRAARPDAAEALDRNQAKAEIAKALRSLRKARGLTQKDVEAGSGLHQTVISRLEAPTGPLPSFDTVRRYVAACEGRMVMGFTLGGSPEAALRKAVSASGPLVAALAI